MGIMLWVATILLTTMATAQQQSPGLLESMLVNLLMGDAADNYNNEPPDQRTLNKEYDFIIIGAGSAGCVVANRLTENPNWKVLLIEAGSAENFVMDIPIIANFLQFSRANWKYFTEPSNSSCLGMAGGRCHWPRGKVMGGSSVLNYMIFTRGNRRDYDLWEANGNTGWGWEDVLPYFKKVEQFEVQDKSANEMHGHKGLMTVSDIPFRTKIADAFVDAAKYMEPTMPVIDYNGNTQTGFNYLQVSMKNGTRWSSNRAYLHSNRRKNLHVSKDSHVTRVLIDPTTKIAYGVEFLKNGKRYTIRAKKEVILSAGAINTPQLLMLSGVGPKEHLEQLGIPVLKDLKVGYNLQDHIAPGGLTFTIDKSYSIKTERLIKTDIMAQFFAYHRGPMSIPGGCEALAFYDLQNPNATDGWADLELLLISGGMGAEPTLKLDFNLDEKLYQTMFKKIEAIDQVMIFPMVMRPKSVGQIKLASKNPKSKPLIYSGYFTDPERNDIKVAIEGIRKSQEVLKTPPFQAMGAKLHKTPLPQCKKYKFDSDKYWDCYSRHLTFTIYHHVGTAKMGPEGDVTAVVDPRLRVMGIKNLRVIDASIMPIIPAAHTNAPTYMIAEKGSDMIKQDWSS